MIIDITLSNKLQTIFYEDVLYFLIHIHIYIYIYIFIHKFIFTTYLLKICFYRRYKTLIKMYSSEISRKRSMNLK